MMFAAASVFLLASFPPGNAPSLAPLPPSTGLQPTPQESNTQKVNAQKDATRDATAKESAAQKGRKELAARVRKAHRGDNRDVLDRFRAGITIQPIGDDVANVSIGLDVSYASKIIRAKGAPPVEMIRYSVTEGDKPLERGKDPRPWQRIGNEVDGLLGRHAGEALELLDSHTRLCKQMLHFLDPGAVISGLRGDEPVSQQTLNLGRSGGKVPCEVIRGQLGSFPIFTKSSKAVRMRAVFLEAWVDKSSGRLRAVKVFPLRSDGKPDTGRGEFVVLTYAKSGSILVPKTLVVYELAKDKRTPRAQVTVSRFAVNPQLSKADFARPRLHKK